MKRRVKKQSLAERVIALVEEARRKVAGVANVALVYTYYETGRMIVEEEQGGKKRAEYGKELLKDLSRKLTDRFGKGWSVETLTKCRYFYTIYSCGKIVHSVDDFFLSWSHYLVLMRIGDPAERAFYEKEAAEGHWSLALLSRQIGSQLYERSLKHKGKTGVKAREDTVAREDTAAREDTRPPATAREDTRPPVRRHPSHNSVMVGHDNRSVVLFVTVCTKDRRRILANPAAHQVIVHAWDAARDWLVGQYVIMPDHVHFCCAPGRWPLPDFHRWIRYWKRLATQMLGGRPSSAAAMEGATARGDTRTPATARGDTRPPVIWQDGCWDTQLRHGENFSAKCDYMLNNPVRAGLVAQAADWPYQGCLNNLQWHNRI